MRKFVSVVIGALAVSIGSYAAGEKFGWKEAQPKVAPVAMGTYAVTCMSDGTARLAAIATPK